MTKFTIEAGPQQLEGPLENGEGQVIQNVFGQGYDVGVLYLENDIIYTNCHPNGMAEGATHFSALIPPEHTMKWQIPGGTVIINHQ